MLFSMYLGTYVCVVSFGLGTKTDNIEDYGGLYIIYVVVYINPRLDVKIGEIRPWKDKDIKIKIF